jgi:hypothetical protein
VIRYNHEETWSTATKSSKTKEQVRPLKPPQDVEEPASSSNHKDGVDVTTSTLHLGLEVWEEEVDDPLRIPVLHTPELGDYVVDILFIHGLGDTSLKTWCYAEKNRRTSGQSIGPLVKCLELGF